MHNTETRYLHEVDNSAMEFVFNNLLLRDGCSGIIYQSTSSCSSMELDKFCMTVMASSLIV